MYLKNLSLQNFRSYTKSQFTFNHETTLIIGPNTSGKTNLLEAVHLLSIGKSFHAEKDIQMIRFEKSIARVKGETGDVLLEVMITPGLVEGVPAPFKKYLVNGVPKRRVDFSGNLTTVVFSPLDLEIISDSPSVRRNFLDDVLEQTDRDYRLAVMQYIKGIRQRNALLDTVKETGIRNQEQFDYWDEIVITNGQLITQRREAFITFINDSQKNIFDLMVMYDKSTISEERLLQYKDAEAGAGVTLVGPHRDDFTVFSFGKKREQHDVKNFGSRGQQRLVVLQLKLLQLSYIEKSLGKRPLLLLDDIFSELDENHIELVLEMIGKQQTIITSAHEDMVPKKALKGMDMIELGRES